MSKNRDDVMNFLKSRQGRPEAREEIDIHVDSEVQRIVGELFELIGKMYFLSLTSSEARSHGSRNGINSPLNARMASTGKCFKDQ